MLGEVLTAAVTPFDVNGAVAGDSFRALCRHLVDNGSDGIVVTGTTGETPTLTDAERLMLYETRSTRSAIPTPSSRVPVRTTRLTPCISPSVRTRSASRVPL